MLGNEAHPVDRTRTAVWQAAARPLPLAGVLTALAGALLLATAGGWALGWQALWAFRFLTFIHWPLRLTMAAIVLLSLAVPPLQHIFRIPSTVFRIPYSVSRIPSWPTLLGSGILFWLFREQTWHGDALLKVKLLSEQTLQSDPYVWKEPLDSLLAYSTTARFGQWGLPPETAVAVLSVVAGVVYVAATLYGVGVVADGIGQRVRYTIGLLALGSAQLWFGHVENYSLVTACSFVAVVLALGYLRGQNKLWPVGLTTGLAVSFHPQAAFIVPALFFLLERRRWLQQSLTLAATGILAPLATVALMAGLGVPWPNVTGGFAGDSQLFLTPAQAIAPGHLWDAANNLWLVAPLAPLWLASGVWGVSRPTLWQQPSFRYLTALAGGLLGYHLFFQNDLPRPQDWDLFAIVAPGFTLWGLYCWEHWSAVRDGESTRQRSVAWAALAFALLFAVGWIGVNHSLTLIHPRSDERAIYARYRLLDLTTLLPQAAVTPLDPICAESVGCERVTATTFTMPQNGDTRPVLFAHAPARVALPLNLPSEATFLWLSPALDPVAWGWGGDGVTFQVAVEKDGVETVLWSRHITPADTTALGWQETFISLNAYQGQTVNLILTTSPGPANNNDADRAGWGLPWLMRGTVDSE